MSNRDELENIHACPEAIVWAEQYPDMQAAWIACERGDWMLWLAGKHSGPAESPGRRKLVLAATECARLAWPYVRKKDHDIIERCYSVAEAWGNNDPTVSLAEVQVAADAAYATAYDADAADAAAAAAAYAAYAAYAADAATAAAADAADADAYDADAARNKVRAECAAIVRLHYPADEIERLIIKWAENRIKFRG